MDINSYCEQHNLTVQDIHQEGIFESNGPWTFRGKNVRIYDTTVTDPKGKLWHVWMRTGNIFIGNEFIEQ